MTTTSNTSSPRDTPRQSRDSRKVAEYCPDVLDRHIAGVGGAGQGAARVVRAEVVDPELEAVAVHDPADPLQRQRRRRLARHQPVGGGPVDEDREHGSVGQPGPNFASEPAAPGSELGWELRRHTGGGGLEAFADDLDEAVLEVDAPPAEAAYLPGP